MLRRWSEGCDSALAELMPLVVGELRDIARRFFAAEPPDHTLQPTAVVNELYLQLAGRRTVSWKNRAHFIGFAAQAIRRILVDHARARRSWKRGGRALKIPIDEIDLSRQSRVVDLLALNDALDRLAALDERQSRIVELYFFGGLTLQEIGEILGISLASASRGWTSARAWLYRELNGE